MSIGFRNTLFILSGALAGFLSGLTIPLEFGVRGALLGGAISAGVVCLNPWRREPVSRILSLSQTIALSIAAGGMAFLAIWLYQTARPASHNSEFGINDFSALPSALSCMVFTSGILLTTRARLSGRRKTWIGFILTAVAGALFRAWSVGEPMAVPYTFLIGALPFVLFWWLSALLADPAWSKKRWDKVNLKNSAP